MPPAMSQLDQPDRDPAEPAPQPPQVDPASGGHGEFDDLAGMAAQLLDAPHAGIAVADGAGFQFVAPRAAGPIPHAQLLPLCAAVAAGQPLLVHDPAPDGLRFWLGIALADGSGHRLGVLWLGDTRPHPAVPELALDGLLRLARIAARLLEQRSQPSGNRIVEQIAEVDFSGVIVVDTHGCVSYANAAAGNLFEHRAVVGVPVQSLFPPDLQANADEAQRWLQCGAAAADGPQPSYDLRLRLGNGSLRTLEAARCAWLAGGDRGMALILRDVTERRLLRDRHRGKAQTDELTGLPRRAAMLAMLDVLLRDGVQPLGVALLGLDKFRTINDTLGHAVGDALLQVIACRLQAGLPPDVRLARFGGDEFAMLYPRADGAMIDAHLRAALHDIARPCQIDHHVIHTEASVGVAMWSQGNDGSELVARADLAMQRAKRGGGHQLRHFEPDMRTEADHRRRLDVELRRACHDGEFELHYQPQVCLRTGLPTGAEALLRWRHPQRGLLAPDKFIDALAESPVGPVVGRWILERACQDAASWPTVAGRRLAVGVNLFPVQFDSERLPGEVDHALARSGLTPAHLELELTETIALRDDGVAASALANLRARGISVAYDDFGTGYASLSVLRRLPVDRVKIDRSFVRDVLANRGDAAIVRSILLIARNFDLRVIAEGVETPEQAALLLELGCQEAQGFLYSPALPPQDFGRWIAARLASQPLREMAVAGHA